MKTIEQLEQEAKQAREDLIKEFSDIFNVSKESAKRLADKFIISSVAMVTYQFAQAEQLRNGDVIKNPSKESYKFVVPDNSRVYLVGGGGIGSGNISTTSSVVVTSGSSGSYKGIVTIGESLPEVSQEERDSDGWVVWSGGQCPVKSSETVEVRFRLGTLKPDIDLAGVYRWHHAKKSGLIDGDPYCDIVAYRIVK